MDKDSEVAAISMADVGGRLRKARENKSLTIDQVQKQTRIHSKILMALEEGRCDDILTQTYVKSFLSKYAHHLGLNPKEIMGEYEALHPEPPQPKFNITEAESKTSPILLKVISVISILFLIIIAVFAIIFLEKKVAGYFKKDKSETGAQIGVHNPKAKAVSRKYAADKTMVFRVSIPKTQPLDLELRVKRSVLIQVKKDGVLLFKKVLEKGTVESVMADQRIDLFIARGESVELALNEKYLGSPGKGQIKNLEITRNGVRIK